MKRKLLHLVVQLIKLVLMVSVDLSNAQWEASFGHRVVD